MSRSIYYPRERTEEEKAAIEFMDATRNGAASQRIDELDTLYNETICDAGRYWQHCEITQGALADIQREIDALCQSWIDRIRDWATD